MLTMSSRERSPIPLNFPSSLGQVCSHGMWHPTVRILEFVQITDPLASRISKQRNHIAIFPNVTDKNLKEDGNCACVNLPFDLNPKSTVGSGVDGINNPYDTWRKVKVALLKLKQICNSGVLIPNVGKLLYDTIEVYVPQVSQYSNFDVLNNQEISDLVVKNIPKIILLAIQLPHLLSKDIPILNSGESRTIYVTRKLCACLLANAFFCTFPAPGMSQKTPDFNFFALYHTNPRFPASANVKREKLKCILNYFEIISKDVTGHHQIVSFERRCVNRKVVWGLCSTPLNSVTVDGQGKIEDCHQMLQVDFANKTIGGGAYRDTCVMEDIRFCISPELLVGRLFSQDLEDDEVLVVTGSEIFSKYTGFASKFMYKEPVNVNFSQATDTLGRTYTQLVAMDAHYFKADNRQQQYEQKYVDRELHKCYVAFIHGPNFVSPVATGNWGSGQFNGDKELKFLIQWMAASLHNRPKLQFHTIQDASISKGIEDISDNLPRKNLTVGDLYKVVCKYHSEYKRYGSGGILKYVKNKI